MSDESQHQFVVIGCKEHSDGSISFIISEAKLGTDISTGETALVPIRDLCETKPCYNYLEALTELLVMAEVGLISEKKAQEIAQQLFPQYLH